MPPSRNPNRNPRSQAMIYNQTSQLAVVMVVFPLLMKFAGKPMNDVLQQVAMKVEVLLAAGGSMKK